MMVIGEWVETPITGDLVRGALELERTARGLRPHRLPQRALAQSSDARLRLMAAQPSGVRLVFNTTATTIELTTMPTKVRYPGAPQRPDGVYDLVVDDDLVARRTSSGGDTIVVDMMTGAGVVEPGTVPPPLRFEGLPPRMKRVEVWLPWDEATELVRLRSDAPVQPVTDDRPVWVHHGSSISHGSNSSGPTATWPATAAALGGVELVNVGLGGGALLDPFTARAMSEVACDLISVKMGINIVNGDVMRRRAFEPAVHGFLDIIRDRRPTTPVVVISPILCPIQEDTPGPLAVDAAAGQAGRLSFTATGDPADVVNGKLTLSVVRDELARIVEQRSATDEHLSYLDGRELYGEADFKERPLPDGVHPSPETQVSMGRRFAQHMVTRGMWVTRL